MVLRKTGDEFVDQILKNCLPAAETLVKVGVCEYAAPAPGSLPDAMTAAKKFDEARVYLEKSFRFPSFSDEGQKAIWRAAAYWYAENHLCRIHCLWKENNLPCHTFHLTGLSGFLFGSSDAFPEGCTNRPF